MNIKSMKTGLKDLFFPPKGNGINRMVRRTTQEMRKGTAHYCMDGGLGCIMGPTLAHLGGINNEVVDVASSVGSIVTLSTLSGSYEKMSNATRQLKSLKASEEYQAIVDRAKKIYSNKI